MNALQEKERELLEILLSVCEQLKLPYYLVCGSALGAVKYRGFIPWDDDIDVGLLRHDYEILQEKAPDLLPEGVFLQNYRTDPAFPLLMSKLRASNSTFIETDKAYLPIHHGVFIDIFPLDGYPRTALARWHLELAKRVAMWKYTCTLTYPKNFRRVRLRSAFFRLLGYHKRTAAVLSRLEKLFARYSTEASDLWCNHANWQGKLEYAPKEQYGEGTLGEFEGLRVRIPKNYDAYLTQKYGFWCADPPVERQKSHHPCVLCDPEKPYTDYIKRG